MLRFTPRKIGTEGREGYEKWTSSKTSLRGGVATGSGFPTPRTTET